jgi:hypothetical protein
MKWSNIGKDIYVTFIFIIVIVKFLFIFFTLFDLVFNLKNKFFLNSFSPFSKFIEPIKDYSKLFDFLFKMLMAILLIYLFNPRNKDVFLDFETRFLLFVYGWILLITFFKDKYLDMRKKAENEKTKKK